MNVFKLIPLIGLLLVASCTSTVTPKFVHDETASFDGNQQNSGFLGFNPDGSGNITAHALDRYNDLIDRYGSRISPPIQHDAGITKGTNGTFVIDAEHIVKFGQMNSWRKEGR